MSAKLLKVGRKWRTASEAWYLDIQHVPYLMYTGVGEKAYVPVPRRLYEVEEVMLLIHPEREEKKDGVLRQRI
jgi:hypothetical protein